MAEDLISSRSRKNALNLARDQILVDYATRLVESDVTIFQVTIYNLHLPYTSIPRLSFRLDPPSRHLDSVRLDLSCT